MEQQQYNKIKMSLTGTYNPCSVCSLIIVSNYECLISFKVTSFENVGPYKIENERNAKLCLTSIRKRPTKIYHIENKTYPSHFKERAIIFVLNQLI